MTVALLGPVLLELAADAAVQAAVTRLRQRGTLRRVAKASYVEARRKDIRVTKRSLKQWLRRADVRSALAAGQVAEDEAAFARLRWLLGDTSGTDRHEQTRELLAIVLFQLLKESNPAHATALSTRWVTAAVADEGRQTRHVIEERHEALVEQLAETRAFPEHLRTLHPWRASRAEELAATWPQIKQLVASVAMASDRETLLDRWGQRPPTTLDEAPSEIWCWLGDVAVDYQARLAAVTFFRRGIDSGAHPSEYWFARAALAIVPDDQRAAEDLLREGGGDHRLCQAIRADLAGDAPLAATEISQWEPASDSDRALKALFLASWRYGQGEHNAAVDMIRTAAQAYPQSSALALRTAEMLMWQVHGEHSLRGSDDVQDALAWAIKARNAMRIWGGQSWRAVKVAIAATGLLHDLDRGYRLTQPPPAGEATAAEAEHPYVAKQAAVLSAMVGQFERAANLAANAGDDYTQATVEALIASETDNREAAQAAWHRAYAAANDDVERMQTAHTMVGFGFDLPDLGALENAFPEGVAELRTIAALPSDPEERLRALRVRAAESRRMTVELAGAYNDRDEFALAGQVLEDGGSRWSDPLLMKMAADRYRRAGDPPAAQRAAEAALSLAAGEWGGETETRMILFDALEAQGDNAGATREAGKLLQLDPANADARWALIYCLARQGDLIGAWNALTPAGDPSPPRDHRDVKAWVALLTRFDRSDQYLRRILDALARWRDQEEVLGALIAQAYLGLSQEGREPAEADLAALHAATKEYTQRFPDSRIFRAVPLDKNDPLGFVAESLRKRHEGLSEVAEMYHRGRLPVGFVAHAIGRDRTEVALQRGPGPRHSHRPDRSAQGAAAVAAALESEVVLDITAASTLAALEPELASALTAHFSRTSTTDADLHDALSAQTSLSLRSGHSMVWDPSQERPRPVSLDDAEVERLALHSTRVFELLRSSRVHRQPPPLLQLRFDEEAEEDLEAEQPETDDHAGDQAEPAEPEEWMGSLELAAAAGTAIWCDDAALQSLADEFGVPVFGTVDLVRHLVGTEQLTSGLGSAVEAVLVDGYHVDLGFDREAIQLAAEIAGWKPAGAALALSRPLAWHIAAEDAMAFLLTALERRPEDSLEDVHIWVANAALGLVRGLIAEQASFNLQLLLGRLLLCAWLRSEHFPMVLSGIRVGVAEVGKCPDPVAPVLRRIHKSLVERHGHPAAASLLMSLAHAANDADRQLVAEIILTS